MLIAWWAALPLVVVFCVFWLAGWVEFSRMTVNWVLGGFAVLTVFFIHTMYQMKAAAKETEQEAKAKAGVVKIPVFQFTKLGVKKNGRYVEQHPGWTPPLSLGGKVKFLLDEGYLDGKTKIILRASSEKGMGVKLQYFPGVVGDAERDKHKLEGWKMVLRWDDPVERAIF